MTPRTAVASLLASTLLASGCALLPSRLPPTPPLLAPSALGQPHAASQTLNVAFGTSDLSLQCALQADAAQVTLIAVGPLGQRALSLRYDGSTLKAEASPYVPAAFPAAQVLSDLQLVLWPSAAWQARLAGSDWQLLEPVPGLRRLRYRGRLVAEVHYADGRGGDAWQGRAWLSNLAYGYTLDIGTQPP
ncbi:MAG: DUF3261 domain-containing protein [Nevskia sp.]